MVKKNIVANILGGAWLALTSIIFIPIYIKLLGVAAWGLIGIFSTLQIVLSLLDMGLSNTLNREMARLSEVHGSGQAMRNLLRSLEIVYWWLALFVGLTLVFLAPLIAKYWINTDSLPITIVTGSLSLMSVIIALQLPIGLYSGGLMGLQKQVVLNVINILISTIRSLGTVLVLWLVSPTIYAFFLWQILMSITNLVLVIFYSWKYLPTSEHKASFNKDIIKSIWRFAAGISGISVLGIMLTQVDKIILSKLISLNDFGYYILASTVAGGIGRIGAPIFNGIYPKFTQLVASGNESELIRIYHKTCELVSVFVLPVAIIIALFSYDLLLLWTHNPLIAERSHLAVSILICGTALNCLMNAPYALQLAHGWVRLALLKNTISIIIFVPLIIYLTLKYGTTGAAFSWLILNIADFVFEINMMHTKLLRNEKWRWYLRDVSIPLAASVLIGVLSKGLIEVFGTSGTSIYLLALISSITFGVTLMSVSSTRVVVFNFFLKSPEFKKG